MKTLEEAKIMMKQDQGIFHTNVRMFPCQVEVVKKSKHKPREPERGTQTNGCTMLQGHISLYIFITYSAFFTLLHAFCFNGGS